MVILAADARTARTPVGACRGPGRSGSRPGPARARHPRLERGDATPGRRCTDQDGRRTPPGPARSRISWHAFPSHQRRDARGVWTSSPTYRGSESNPHPSPRPDRYKPGRSLPGPDAGHPLQGTGGHGAVPGQRDRPRLARSSLSPFSHGLVRRHRTRSARIGHSVDPDLRIRIPAHCPGQINPRSPDGTDSGRRGPRTARQRRPQGPGPAKRLLEGDCEESSHQVDTPVCWQQLPPRLRDHGTRARPNTRSGGRDSGCERSGICARPGSKSSDHPLWDDVCRRAWGDISAAQFRCAHKRKFTVAGYQGEFNEYGKSTGSWVRAAGEWAPACQ